MALNQTALFAQIHATLLAAITQFPKEADAIPRVPMIPGRITGGRYNMRTTPDTPAVWETTTFTFGTLKITCAATQEGILRVAEKYSRIPAYLALSRPPNAKRKPLWMNTRRAPDAEETLAAPEREFSSDYESMAAAA